MITDYENLFNNVIGQKVCGISQSLDEITISVENGMDVIYKLNNKDADGFVDVKVEKRIKN